MPSPTFQDQPALGTHIYPPALILIKRVTTTNVSEPELLSAKAILARFPIIGQIPRLRKTSKRAASDWGTEQLAIPRSTPLFCFGQHQWVQIFNRYGCYLQCFSQGQYLPLSTSPYAYSTTDYFWWGYFTLQRRYQA